MTIVHNGTRLCCFAPHVHEVCYTGRFSRAWHQAVSAAVDSANPILFRLNAFAGCEHQMHLLAVSVNIV